MALTVGVNSWCTVAEANAYLENKFDTREWFTSIQDTKPKGMESKETLLVSAFYWLYNSPDLNLSPTLTSQKVKNAQAEAAWYLYNHFEELDARRAEIYSGLTEFELSKRREELEIKNIKIPDFIIGMLPEYMVENYIVELRGQYDI